MSSMTPKPDPNNGNVQSLPATYRFAWMIFQRAGLATLLVIAAAMGVGYWIRVVAAPEAAARLELLKQVADNNCRTLSCMDKIADYEAAQVAWQMEWKTYISDQHKQRAAESSAIILHQQNAETFFARTDRIHDEQIRTLQELLVEIRSLRMARIDTHVMEPKE